jgi:hypothetical protein
MIKGGITMMRKTALIGAAVLAAACLTACGSGHNGGSVFTPTQPPPPQTDQLDTAQVLAMAQRSSEISSPLNVDGGVLTITDTSDTAEAISVNGM